MSRERKVLFNRLLVFSLEIKTVPLVQRVYISRTHVSSAVYPLTRTRFSPDIIIRASIPPPPETSPRCNSPACAFSSFCLGNSRRDNCEMISHALGIRECRNTEDDISCFSSFRTGEYIPRDFFLLLIFFYHVTRLPYLAH